MEKKKKNDELPSLPPSDPVARHSIWLIVFAGAFLYFMLFMGVANDCTGTGTGGTLLAASLLCEWGRMVPVDIIGSAIVSIALWYYVDGFSQSTIVRALIVLYLLPGHWLLVFILAHIQIPAYRL